VNLWKKLVNWFKGPIENKKTEQWTRCAKCDGLSGLFVLNNGILEHDDCKKWQVKRRDVGKR